MLNNKNQTQNYMAYEIIISENMNKKKGSYFTEVICLKSRHKIILYFFFVNYFHNNWMWMFIVCSQRKVRLKEKLNLFKRKS